MLPIPSSNESLADAITKLEAQFNCKTDEFAFATLQTQPLEKLSLIELLCRFTPRGNSPESTVVESSSSLDNPWNENASQGTPSGRTDGENSLAYSDILRIITQAKLCCSAPDSPIVAVMGLLNAGKSSLVSTYLSEANRKRILIGSANAQGTHRFVLWAPESWRKDDRIWNFVLTRLRSVFGCDCELLSETMNDAAAQYNDTVPREYVNADGLKRFRPTIEIPLLATDPELDRWGIAIMDCPDVQTGLLPAQANSPQGLMVHEQAQSISDLRWRVLQTAAPLCSAFVVVLPANAIHDQTVSRLMRLLQHQMSAVRQIVAVNRVPRKYTSKQISDEIQLIYGNQSIDRQYMAYGFDGPIEREKIPNPPDSYEVPTLQTLPLFFRIDSSVPPQPPEPIQDADWLLNIGSQLDKRSLANELLQSTLHQLQARTREGIAFCQKQEVELKGIVQNLQQTIAQSCYEFSSEGSKRSSQPVVRLQASKQIVNQIASSLERTAPWWAMPGRWASRVAESTKTTLAKATTLVSLPEWMRGSKWFTGKTESIGKWIRSRWSSGDSGRVVTSDNLVSHLRRFDKLGSLNLDRFSSEPGADSANLQRITAICQAAIDRFQNESNVLLDAKQLDQFTTRVWEEMPLSKRLFTGLAPAGILFAPLIAVIMMPLDFGGSAVLVFASLKELLFAGAAGVGLMMASSDSMPQIAEAEVAWQQLGDLIAVLCDELGIRRPRESDGIAIRLNNNARPISISQIPPRPPAVNNQLSPGETLLPVEFAINAHSLQAIETTLSRLRQR